MKCLKEQFLELSTQTIKMKEFCTFNRTQTFFRKLISHLGHKEEKLTSTTFL